MLRRQRTAVDEFGNGAFLLSMARRQLGLVLIASGLAATVALGSACDPLQSVTFENRTNHTVTVFERGVEFVTLAPSEEKDFDSGEFIEETSEAKDEGGRVIYSETLTWEELRERDWRIVITESTPDGSPTPSKPAATPAP